MSQIEDITRIGENPPLESPTVSSFGYIRERIPENKYSNMMIELLLEQFKRPLPQ